MRDLRFLELMPLKIPVWPLGITAPVCVAARDKFKEGLRSVVSLKMIMGVSHRCGYDWRKAEERAGRGIKKMKDGKRKEGITAKAAWDFYMEKAPTVADWEESDRRMNVMLQLEEIHATVERLMHGIVILAWTSVEVLLHDLLFGSIAAHGNKPDTAKSKAKPGVKQREAYLFWFNHYYDSPAVRAAIKSDSIHALGAVRHAIVHKAAFMDELFFSDMNGDASRIPPRTGSKILKARYPCVAMPIPPQKWPHLALDGEFIRVIVEGAIRACFDLLRAVNKWELAQPP